MASPVSTERIDRVELITIDLPEKKNSLSQADMAVLNEALDRAEVDDGVAVIIITGSGDVFSVGADLKDMEQYGSMAEVEKSDFITRFWEQIPRCRKPVIAAVNGAALGGGCELALMCDIIICSESAQFGQPEALVGVMPGAGGTQRLTRIVGKSLAMEMCLTGRRLDAKEAQTAGLVSQVVAPAKLREAALELAGRIAGCSQPVSRMIKESVNSAYETTLAQGLKLERKLCHATFSLEDHKEGIDAFKDRRKPKFQDR